MLLKLTSAPCFTEPTQSSDVTGTIFGGSRYQAPTLLYPFVNGIEISKGLDKSIEYFLELYFISAIKIH